MELAVVNARGVRRSSLVAYHSGACFEAAERGLSRELAELAEPTQELQDVLTLVDMTTSPTGEWVSLDERLREILGRYGKTIGSCGRSPAASRLVCR
jgi:hypothetical protein